MLPICGDEGNVSLRVCVKEDGGFRDGGVREKSSNPSPGNIFFLLRGMVKCSL